MILTIEWNRPEGSDWDFLASKTRRATLLQCPDYVACVAGLAQRPGLIFIDGAAAGLCLLQETGALRNFLHVTVLDRGPLWFEGFGTQAHIDAFFTEINRQFPRRPGRKRRFMPEAQAVHVQALRKRNQIQGYETLWLDLRQDDESLRANMRKNWRNALAKAERSVMVTDWDLPESHVPWLLKVHALDKATRGYGGASMPMLQSLASRFGAKNNLLLGRALVDGKAVGAILLLCHGSGTTYQVGWANEEGHKQGAHHLLLWQACAKLKERSVYDFDLGGINDEGAKGVKIFKEGTGAAPVRLAGTFC